MDTTNEIINEPYKVELYQTIKEIGNILSQDATIDIIFHLSNEPMRYKDLKKLLNSSDATLSRRLDKLMEYNVIESLPVVLGKKHTHEYTVTELGQELIRFFRNYEKRRQKIKVEVGSYAEKIEV